MNNAGLDDGKPVWVRSSGTAETMRNRGGLVSQRSQPSEITATIQRLRRQLQGSAEEVHWVIQQAVEQKALGHLSNERHLSYENRDWVTEFEPRNGHPGYTAPIAVRRWRDGTDLRADELLCISEPEITLRLKNVARWATQFSSRIHFEWVWDGAVVSIVQADPAERHRGVDPRSLLAVNVPLWNAQSFQSFHSAEQSDYERYDKLSNAHLYRTLGYEMPEFYVADETPLIDSILAGEIPEPLERDLNELTRRPLIIRTDGRDIPAEKREMLPRSDELRSSTEAKEWLLGKFRLRIHEAGLENSHVCLIAHHFIPSVASAWARAEPGNRIVRVESLWGIPEGLYWYSHDTFEIDTQATELGASWLSGPPSYTYRERIRYKGTFVSPDPYGKWGPVQTLPPYEWRRSITKASWLSEIAHVTRQVAERENYPISLMWFVGNHPEATMHKVLPWFHSRSEFTGTPKAAPRHKLAGMGDYSITSAADWTRFQSDLQAGRRIERVVVEPADAELIRNNGFAEDLATVAASQRIVVELAGGILSHVYYILQRHGAQVECVDLFGTQEDTVEYNKIVRDKIPVVIAARGERVETIHLRGDALLVALREKLVEEAFEALDAKSGEDLVGELADVGEVVGALCQALRVKAAQLKSVRWEKRRRRGGFEGGLMLTRTATPHSIQRPHSDAGLSLGLTASEPVISDAASLPTKPFYYRPDLRQIDQDIEKLFTFEAEANKLGQVKEVLTFSMPTGRGARQSFTLTVELRRSRTSVRGVVRLRTGPEQLELNLSGDGA
jgi:predicted house-cleaning noncanonical NTP pyrophosphatase (MazG superfamily)